MTPFKIILLALATVGIILLTPQRAQAATINIDIKDFQFTPQSITIAPGDTVVWTNRDSMAHTATSDSQTGNEVWDSDMLQQGKSYSKTFTTTGTYPYHCTPHPNMTATITVVTPTPIPPTPTRIPTRTPTPTTIPTAPPTPTIPPTITPTNPANPAFRQPTKIVLTMFLNGIGQAGDSIIRGTGNPTPNRIMRPVVISIYNRNNTLVAINEMDSIYVPQNGNFTGTATIGGLAATYKIKIKTDGFIEKELEELAIPGQTLTIPPLYFVTGDINNDNQLNTLDYNFLVNCYEAKATSSSCMDAMAADVNDDGQVNGIDYNLFLRELSVISKK